MAYDYARWRGLPSNARVGDIFLDVDRLVLNLDYFQPYFDRVSLPRDLAQECLTDMFERGGRLDADPIRFVRLSELRQFDRLPSWADVGDQLVPTDQVPNFRLASGFGWGSSGGQFGYEIVGGRGFSPCVFVSHRWRAVDHPDPDGTQLRSIVQRADAARRRRSWWHRPDVDELYLWIDYCCLPRSRAGDAPAADELALLEAGLRRIPEVIKNCDLMLLYSTDYLDRAWCFAELLVWLCRYYEAKAVFTDPSTGLARSALTSNLGRWRRASNAHHRNPYVLANLVHRGYGGSYDDISQLYETIGTYCGEMQQYLHYWAGESVLGFYTDYVPTMVKFVGDLWVLFQDKQSTMPEDLRVCLRIAANALRQS